MILVIYAILAEQNIVKMFMAALLPGLLAALGYVITVAVYVRVNPAAGPVAPRVPLGQRWGHLAATWPVIAIFGLTIGGIIGDGWSNARLPFAVLTVGIGVITVAQVVVAMAWKRSANGSMSERA